MKHFLDISDHSPDEIQDLLDLAIRLKKEHFAIRESPLVQRKSTGDDLSKTQPANTGFF